MFTLNAVLGVSHVAGAFSRAPAGIFDHGIGVSDAAHWPADYCSKCSSIPPFRTQSPKEVSAALNKGDAHKSLVRAVFLYLLARSATVRMKTSAIGQAA
jgi:hypothetical protein